ncbi:putative DNA oxidative demethylase [Helianthus annuus]|nr:putative DNA oxidative demethylase [Helianthus annuus]
MKSENTVVGLIGEMLNPVSEITGPKANVGLKLKSENAVVGSIGEMLNPVSEIAGPKANAGLELKSENAVIGSIGEMLNPVSEIAGPKANAGQSENSVVVGSIGEMLNPVGPNANGDGVRDLGNGSSVVYFPRFLSYEKSWEYFHYLDKHIPWTRPTIYVFGKPFVQPRDVCYIASKGLKELIYSGHKPDAHSWDDYPPLKEILEEVHKAFPGSHFNSLLINRYNSGNDYVGWHADDEKLYGPNPEIASISFGCERDFFLKTKSQGEVVREPPSKRAKKNKVEKHCFKLKHGSLLLMRGNTQRDWLHSVPKRAKAESARINLTFRRVMQMSSRRLLL